MRKYVLPKYLYIILIVIVCALSVGYTFAYFSATTIASGSLGVDKVYVSWLDSNGANISMLSNKVDSIASIALVNPLKMGNWTQIQCQTTSGEEEVHLTIGLMNNDGTWGDVNAYYRMKIKATYTIDGNTNDLSSYIKLGYKDNGAADSVPVTEITGRGWKLDADDGYYYRKDAGGNMLTLTPGGSTAVANYIYLDDEVGVDLFGATVSISIIAEAIQATNGATW